MVIITYYPLAVAVSFLTMLCWGSWANAQKLTNRQVPTTIFYRDYTYGILITSIVLAFTFGSFGSAGRSFIADLRQADTQALFMALMGGFVFNVANILIVAGVELAGLSVAMPVGVGVALILGVIVNYLRAPAGNLFLLGVGILAIGGAVVLGAMACRARSETGGAVSSRGLVLSLVGGFLMSFFFYFLGEAMASDFASPAAGLLSPYSALFLFAVGVVISTPFYLPILRKYASMPADGDIWYVDVSRKNHRIGQLGGVIWCLGMASSLLASGTAGFAISYGLGQGATLIAVLWGVFLWREFRGAPRSSNRYLMMMGACYVLGLVLIIAAR